tara:strand:- start:50 stop:310 length:261 start_codon:yes stop_codon:yes gene_type:complete
MNIEAKDYNIEMSYNELWTLAFSVRGSLKYSIETHWVNHQDSWEEGEREKLNVIEMMFNALGRHDLYDDIFPDAITVFKEFKEKQN